ncbi:DUF3795 domain-containing protein [Lachnoclostridium phytofermentans]|uniref:DUF3795 domain-containing protein n=1 Tax=Lachnoclostridium phytofermentans (strain ATCC 700394 / DSM 18823 / ISDg) TaxID=357809 RepID=A9KJB2_LACP7|nr:DUF3795 domain-containing protein [Lachnoclostridium phytofermentans]ABX42524.1 hypothetical protein Cphy_2158 [Lachnoclostridium phytofermentans ISDg]
MKFGLCGIDCTQCDSLQAKECMGCNAMQGFSFYGKCQWYHCCKDKGIEHCGKCEYFPCSDLKDALAEVGGLPAIDNLNSLLNKIRLCRLENHIY